jgi:hypothetical protein
MDFGKFGGLGNIANLASLGSIGKGSSNFIIWLLLAVIVFGFGKGRSVFESGIFQIGKVPETKHQSRRRYRGAPPVTAPPLMGFRGLGFGGTNGFLGGNGIFIIAVVALLLLCKDKTDEEVRDGYMEADEANIE